MDTLIEFIMDRYGYDLPTHLILIVAIECQSFGINIDKWMSIRITLTAMQLQISVNDD